MPSATAAIGAKIWMAASRPVVRPDPVSKPRAAQSANASLLSAAALEG